MTTSRIISQANSDFIYFSTHPVTQTTKRTETECASRSARSSALKPSASPSVPLARPREEQNYPQRYLAPVGLPVQQFDCAVPGRQPDWQLGLQGHR